MPGTSSRTADTATFSGSSSVTPITLDVSPTLAALSFSGTNYTLSGGSLTLTGPARVVVSSGTQTIQSAIVLGNSASFAPQSGTQLNLGGNISEATPGQALSLTDAGTLVSSGTANSYTGGTYVDEGTLYVTNSSALPDGTSLTVGAGGVFVFDPSVSGAPSLAVSRGDVVAAVPEPGTIALLLATLWSAVIYYRFRPKAFGVG